MKIVRSIPMMFDDVSFGIAVREQRQKIHWTQNQLAAAVGYTDGNSISRIECATDTDSISIHRYLSICNVLHLNPMHYWDFVPDTFALSSFEVANDD